MILDPGVGNFEFCDVHGVPDKSHRHMHKCSMALYIISIIFIFIHLDKIS